METSSSTAVSNKRLFSLDFARAIAIIAVISNHAVNRSFNVYHNTASALADLPMWLYIFRTAVCIFSRIGVPLFLMITGALILKKDFEKNGSVMHFLKHNYLNLFITTEIWMFLMFCMMSLPNLIKNFSDGGIGKIALAVIKNQLFLDNTGVCESMWYMAMILCLYPLLPAFSIALKKLDKMPLYIAAVIGIFAGMIVPTITKLSPFFTSEISFESFIVITTENSEKIDYYFIYLIYIFVGYLSATGKFKKISTAALISASVIAFVSLCAMQIYVDSFNASCIIEYNSFGILILSASLFELINRYADRIKHLRKPITELSIISFGVYFVHIIVIRFLIAFTPGFSSFSGLLKLAILFFVSLAVSIVSIEILSKIKFFKKYVFSVKR